MGKELHDHTPGPWKWETSIYEHMGAGIRSIPDDRGIAQIWQHANVVADAALIAAAPAMLEALKAIALWSGGGENATMLASIARDAIEAIERGRS